MRKIGLLFLLGSLAFPCVAQYKSSENSSGWFSLGGRSTISAFGHEGSGIGTGGQFRIQLSNQVNTEWFADYISITESDKIRSIYYHIGWSVLFYPMKDQRKVQPYILAGHCFDFNRKTVVEDPSVTKGRWGSAIQAGVGNHFHLTDKFDLSCTAQYMIHLTNTIESEESGGTITFSEHDDTALEGHLLITVSVNYKIAKLWKSQ